jgi:hypothetical protein
MNTIQSIGSCFRMRKPLRFQITKDDGEYRAEIPQIELYSFAESAEEAARELYVELVDLCGVLFDETTDHLSLKTLAWKLYLQQFVAPDSE